MSDRTIHMIGNGHIDPVWLWQWQEGFQEVKATFRSALDRMNEVDDFVFTTSSAAFFEWVEKNAPDMFAEIRQRVAEGRLEIVGGWWIEPDCNIPGGESFVRQGLYGQRYFQEKFNTTASVGYNVDSFGHNGTLPQILKKSGMDNYVFMRPGPHEEELPGHLFWWESSDGSRVLTFRIHVSYATSGRPLNDHIQKHIQQLDGGYNRLMCFYGVGNHGGGPTKENLRTIQAAMENTDNTEIVFDTVHNFFHDLRADAENGCPELPTVQNDLQHHASGCYAAHSGIKRWNRRAENRLITAEKFAAIAERTTGQPYPRAELTRAWKNVLFNQFHDILAGTSLEEAYEDARNNYGEAMSIADRALNYAVQSLAWNIKIPYQEGVKPVVVMNPHAWPARMNLEVESRDLQGTEILVDDDGNEIPMQVVQSHGTARRCARFTFTAELPALGYRVYRLVPEGEERREGAQSSSSSTSATAPSATDTSATDTLIENDRLQLEIDRDSGCIARLYDKRHDVEVFDGLAARPVVIEDTSDTWSHGVFRFDQEIGTFKPDSIKLVEDGPVRSTIRVESVYGTSRLIQEFTVCRDIDPIDVNVEVDWREQHKMLKLRFPTNLDGSQSTYEIPYGTIERPDDGEEEPGQNWVDVSGLSPDTGQPYGLSLLNDAKYSYNIQHGEIGLTVLRSPIYAHHVPIEPDPDEHYSFIDQGIQRFRYALLPHEGTWKTAGTVKRAAELNQPPVPLIETFHEDGHLPQVASYLSVEQENTGQGNVVVSVLKQAEDSPDLVLRCYETNGEQTSATIRLPQWNRTIEADFGPSEIKTFRIPRQKDLPVVETNLLEWIDAN